LRTLVDGNNLLWAFTSLRKLMLAKQRDAARRGLVELIRRVVRGGRLKPPVTVVFDGSASAEVIAEASRGEVEVRFAPHPDDADHVIGDTVERGSATTEFTVVTSDRELQARARRSGARVVGVRKFIEEHAPRPTRGRRRPKTEEDDGDSLEKPRGPLSDCEVDRWLKEFGLED
jgi:predicted RNA-binding protein with PIN domain